MIVESATCRCCVLVLMKDIDGCLQIVFYFCQTIPCCTNYICTAWNSLIEIITAVTTDGNPGVILLGMKINIVNVSVYSV